MYNKNIPLCVDCDGTLIKTDLLHEAVFLLIKQHFFKVFLIPFWLIKGKAYLKAQLAQLVEFNWASLPVREEVTHTIINAKRAGRKIVLATASPKVWANGIAKQLNLFDEVLATENGTNLSGKNKASKLVALYGEAKFDYIGDAKEDFYVWQKARYGIKVSSNTNPGNNKNIISFISTKKATVLDFVKGIRVYQWLKNALIFLPILASHQFTNLAKDFDALLAFFAFSACASAIYVLNDLLDLESDRLHIRKWKRPFASCIIPIQHGAILVPILLAIAFGIALYLPPMFLVVLLAYLVMTIAYSIILKKQVVVDIIMLAALYTVRILAGAAATDIVPSFWLLEFSLFFFLSLALVKRYSELLVTIQQNKKTTAGRGYRTEDLTVIMCIGAASALISVLVFSNYINAPETANLYSNKYWLWGVVPFMLYWNSRLWMKTQRHEVEDDPILFAVKDWQTMLMLPFVIVLFVLAVKL